MNLTWETLILYLSRIDPERLKDDVLLYDREKDKFYTTAIIMRMFVDDEPTGTPYLILDDDGVK